MENFNNQQEPQEPQNTNIPEQPSIVEFEEKKNPRRLIIGVLFLIVFIIFISLYIFKDKVSIVKTTDSEMENSSMALYQNDILGISILRPSKYKVEESIGGANKIVVFTNPDDDSSVVVRFKELHSNEEKGHIWLDQLSDSKESVKGVEYYVYKSDTGYGDGPGFSPPYVTYILDNSQGDDVIIEFYGDSKMSNQEFEILESLKIDMSTSADWKVYENGEYGFSFSYSNNWNLVGEGKPLGKSASHIKWGILFRNATSIDEWGVQVMDGNKTSIENQITQQGGQFDDRVEKREIERINDISMLKVTVTTETIPNWFSVQLYFERNGNIYILSNGARKHADFNGTYESFKFTD